MEFAPPPLPGDRLGPYVLGRTLGLGGVATVFEATDPAGGRVAVKVLHPGRTRFEQVRRFRREFVALQAVNHPGVVRVLAVGREVEVPWMAMEYVDGVDLEETLRRWEVAPPTDRFGRIGALLRDLCDALGAVHAAGLIHRDIKPSNILLTPDGRPKLIDFGLVADMSVPTLNDGQVVGTFAFVAPERVRGGVADSRADLYGLGVVLYALLTGQLPFQAETADDYVHAQVDLPPRAPSEIDPRIPRRLERICLTLLEKDPARRFASARQVRQALDDREAEDQRPVRGREEILAAILARMASVGAVGGGVVVVTGEAGMGKSAVLAEAVRRARAGGQDVAFSAEGGPVLERLAEQLPDLGVAREGPGTAAERLVRQTLGRPWALVIDDADRLSPPDLAALTALARDRVAVEGDPLLLVISVARPDGPAAPLATGAQTGLAPLALPLGPLSEADLLALLGDLGLAGGAARTLAARLTRDLGGCPGAVARQVALLEAGGWLVREGRSLRSAVGFDLLREAVLPGDGAPPPLGEGLAAAEALAVLGGAASRVLLDAVGADAAGIGALLAGGWGQDVSEGTSIAFSGPALAAAVYRTMGRDRRRSLHRAAAVALRALGGPEGAVPLGEVADHLLLAGVPEEALPLLLEAARRALRAPSPEGAARLLRRALDIRGAAEARMSPEQGRRTRLRGDAVEAELRMALDAGAPAGSGPGASRA